MTKIEPLIEAIHEELFGIGYVDHLRPDFIKYLHIRNSEYHIFRLIHYFTFRGLNGGYLTLSRSKIASILGRSMTTVDEGLRDLCRRGLIIRERISRDGREIVAYRVDLSELEERIKNEKLCELEKHIKSELPRSLSEMAKNEERTKPDLPTDNEPKTKIDIPTDNQPRIKPDDISNLERCINAERLCCLRQGMKGEKPCDLSDEKAEKLCDLSDISSKRACARAAQMEAEKLGA